MKDTIRFVLTLALVTLVSAFLLSYLYTKVEGNIEKQKKAKLENAIKYVLNTEEFEKVEGEKTSYWKIPGNDDKFAVRCSSQGFDGLIDSVVGINREGEILKIKVIQQQETPGLGAKMDAVKSNKYIWDFITGKKREKLDPTPYFQKQFFGEKYEDLEVVKQPSDDPGSIEALTGATISSKAVVQGIKDGAKKLMEEVNK